VRLYLLEIYEIPSRLQKILRHQICYYRKISGYYKKLHLWYCSFYHVVARMVQVTKATAAFVDQYHRFWPQVRYFLWSDFHILTFLLGVNLTETSSIFLCALQDLRLATQYYKMDIFPGTRVVLLFNLLK